MKGKDVHQNDQRSPKADSKSKITEQDKFKTIRKLKRKIAVSRRKLQKLWDTREHTDADVLKASIELDDLLNLYQKTKKS